jgi:hypothetical protein
MRKFMNEKIKGFGVLIIGLLAFSCSDEFDANDFKGNSSIKSLNGTWKVISFEDFNQQTVETKTQENSWGTDIIVFFNDTLDPKIFGGTITTNSVAGEFEYINERKFKLLRYSTTFVGQPDWGNKFGRAVAGEVVFKIDDDKLRFYYDNKTKSVTLIRE